MDIGLLFEWLYDSRRRETPSGFYDASFVATRMAFNNAASTELLAGAIFSNNTANLSLLRVEASHRLGDDYSVGAEIHVVEQPSRESTLFQLRRNDYFQLAVSDYF